jgi:phosphoribosylaminoimidazolecarboxamide formyltransferase/IMP cyclohydrolase
MPEPTKVRRALISVYDKTGIVDFARALHDEFGVEIISTGGTAKTLTDAGIPVALVEDITGFPELLDGRVKTLHPRIFAAILADRENPEHMQQLKAQGIEPIDMVVVNLYPFEETVAKPDCKFEEALEMIDIGGVSLLRAAAKNHKHVLVLVDPAQYEFALQCMREEVLSEHGWRSVREDYAMSVFQRTSQYDARILSYLARRKEEEIGIAGAFDPVLTQYLFSDDVPRYGENPHQKAGVFALGEHDSGPLRRASWQPSRGLEVLEHKHFAERENPPLSFNNYADASAALELCAELTRAGKVLWAQSLTGRTVAVCCFIKHTNACGVGIADDPIEAYRRAYLGDPKAAMGGILAVNFNVDAALAEAVMDSLQRWGKDAGSAAFFVEVWLAPSFDEAAVKLIRTRKKWGERVRLLDVGDMTTPPDANELEFKSIAGGMLAQTRDSVGLNEEQWKVVTGREPTEQEMADLRLAWLIAKHTKSNAISICKDGMLIGSGAGQMSRVMSCRIATWLAKDNGHEEKLGGAAAASDGFFPFRDGPDLLADAGVSAIIQPGGSKRDQAVIDAANERGIAMIFTGTRHFKH